LLTRVFFSPDERRLRAGWRILIQLLLMLLLVMILAPGVGLFVVFNPGISSELLAFLGQVVTMFAITLSVFIARGYFDRRTFSSLGLQIDRQSLVDLLVGIGIAALIMGVIFAVQWGAGWLVIDGFAWEMETSASLLDPLGTALILFIFVSWQEELLARGYWLQNLADGIGLRWAVILSSAVFSLLHMANPGANVMAAWGLFISGLFLAYGYVATRRLWLPIGLHIGWNFFEGPIFGFPVSGLDFPGLILHTDTGHELITGGAFGPEAGLVLLIGLALGAGLIYLYSRRNYAQFT
jgi:uncharacterized protein